MVLTSDCTVATATTDTTEATIGTITLPPNATKIYAVGVVIGGAGLTTLESTTGMMRVSINGIDVAPAKFAFGGALPLTSGVYHSKPQSFPVNWSGVGNSVLTFYVTMDMATTVANTARCFCIYEKS